MYVVFSFNIVTEFKPNDKLNTLIAMEINEQILEFIDAGHSFALATVLKADGSTPQKVGTKAIIDAAGKIWGTIGGGQVEAQTQQLAVQVCNSKHPVVFDMSFEGDCAKAESPICGGTMHILIDPTIAKNIKPYAEAANTIKQRRRGILLTKVCSASQIEVTIEWLSQETILPEVGFPGQEAILSCLACEKANLFSKKSQKSQTSLEVLVEPIIPRPLLLIAGGGHIGHALTMQAVQLGFDVTVIDDRPEFTNSALFPESVTTRCANIPEELASLEIDQNTFIVIVTRGHKQDAPTLAACIHSRAAYIGMIGSKRKVALICENFIESNLATEQQFNRVFAPIGLDIGALTVPEIATSIAAQLIAVRRRGRDYTAHDDKVLR